MDYFAGLDVSVKGSTSALLTTAVSSRTCGIPNTVTPRCGLSRGTGPEQVCDGGSIPLLYSIWDSERI